MLPVVMQIYNGKKTVRPHQLRELNTDELMEFKRTVDTDLAEIGRQLGLARSKAAATGEYANSEWFQKAVHAKKLKGRLSQAIQSELGRRRREHGEEARQIGLQSLAERLLKAMDAVLTPEHKQKVVEYAKTLKNAEMQ